MLSDIVIFLCFVRYGIPSNGLLDRNVYIVISFFYAE